ncbi:hypothetical protein EJB05_07750, partial [Eragrostis curvula]
MTTRRANNLAQRLHSPALELLLGVIHTTIGKNLIDTYRPQIREGSIYAFSNFRVQESIKYHPVSNDLKIMFIYNTKATSATRLYTDLDVPETWKLIDRYNPIKSPSPSNPINRVQQEN